MSSQATISSFFTPSSKRKTKNTQETPIDLTLSDSDGEQPAKKRRRTIDSSPSPNGSFITSPSSSSADKWKYSAPVEDSPRPPAAQKVTASRTEAFKKKLLQGNNLLLRRKSDKDEEYEPEPTTVSTNNHAVPPKRGTISHEPYTPLEKQVLKLKEANPGTVLMFEVGYRYKFYQEDAMIAAKELGMVCFRDRNLNTASIPTHRRDVHLKKLLSCGYRVGICAQTETAALKKIGDNRNTPFERQVTNLYTAATYIHSIDEMEDQDSVAPPAIICIVENLKRGSTSQVTIALVSIVPSSGEVVWDLFDDGAMRLELETRLSHLCSSSLGDVLFEAEETTRKLLKHLGSKRKGWRMEPLEDSFTSGSAYNLLAEFISVQRSEQKKLLLSAMDGVPKACHPALAHLASYLSKFGIAGTLLDARFFRSFRSKTHMLLEAKTLQNLEITQNSIDGGIYGTLFSVLDRTKTKFGARQLKSWLARPLMDLDSLRDRLGAVEEIMTTSSDGIALIQQSLDRTPDLSRGISRIAYGQSTSREFSIMLSAFEKIAGIWLGRDDPFFESVTLNTITAAFSPVYEIIAAIRAEYDIKQGREGNMDILWKNPDKYPDIGKTKRDIQIVEDELKEELKNVRKLLRLPGLQYSRIGDTEYIVEVRKSDHHQIPPTWTLLSKTKFMARYHPPGVLLRIARLEQLRETLEAACRTAFTHFLNEVTQKYYYTFRDMVNKLAQADCFMSLAQISLANQYVKPVLTEEDKLELENGRHPVQEAIRSDPQVPNSTSFETSRGRHKVLTGPNMAGKSSYVRMVAVICLMAQCGCFVPAKSLAMRPLDRILTRMGASDDILRGRSTFMMELEQTSTILSSATSSSLIILDELGRGTSTHDGYSIAAATLEYLITRLKCKTFFITHYPAVSQLEWLYEHELQNLHMAYESRQRLDGSHDITFLYRVVPGVAEGSFGIECGRLAGLPEDVLFEARTHADALQEIMAKRAKKRKASKIIALLREYKKTGTRSVVQDLLKLQDS